MSAEHFLLKNNVIYDGGGVVYVYSIVPETNKIINYILANTLYSILYIFDVLICLTGLNNIEFSLKILFNIIECVRVEFVD